MGLDFVILSLLALAFFWFAGRVIDDIVSEIDAQWTKSWAHEDISKERRDQ
jgi:hypothetical protein